MVAMMLMMVMMMALLLMHGNGGYRGDTRCHRTSTGRHRHLLRILSSWCLLLRLHLLRSRIGRKGSKAWHVAVVIIIAAAAIAHKAQQLKELVVIVAYYR